MVKMLRKITLILLTAVLVFSSTTASGSDQWLVEISINTSLEVHRDDPGIRVLWRTDDAALVKISDESLQNLQETGVETDVFAMMNSRRQAFVLFEKRPDQMPVTRLPDAVTADGHEIYFYPAGVIPPESKDAFFYRLPESGPPLSSLFETPYQFSSREYDPAIQTVVDSVNQTRQYAILETLCNFQTRYSYSTGCENAVAWAASTLEDWGLMVDIVHHTNGMAGNVIATQIGQVNPDRVWIVGGHLDSTSDNPNISAPGADDNGTGSVLTLHCAELLHNFTFDDTIIYALWTGEEQGLYGSSDWAANASAQGMNIQGYLNFDMVGWSDPAPEDLDIIVNNSSSSFGQDFQAITSQYTTLSIDYTVDGSMGYSDHYPFWNNGFASFCGIEDYWPTYPYYHTTNDTIDKIDFDLLGDCTRAAVAALCTFAGYTTGAATPTPVPTDTPLPTHTPTSPPGEPTYTPHAPTTTPTPTGEAVRVEISMPAHFFAPGDPCGCTVDIVNTTGDTYESIPLFVVLDVYGNIFFAPTFDGFNYYQLQIPPGTTQQIVLETFSWPETSSHASDLKWYAALTDVAITQLFGMIDTWEFGF